MRGCGRRRLALPPRFLRRVSVPTAAFARRLPMSVLDDLFGDVAVHSLSADASGTARQTREQAALHETLASTASASAPSSLPGKSSLLSLLSSHFVSPSVPRPCDVWGWVLQGRLAEALCAVDAVAACRAAQLESELLEDCRTRDDDLERAIWHRDRMRLMRAVALSRHATASFCADFANLALQPFLSEAHCCEARRSVLVALRGRFSASLEQCQSWARILDRELRQLRGALACASEALEALCLTQATTAQELVLAAALVQLNRSVFYLCAKLLDRPPSAGVASAAPNPSGGGGGAPEADADEIDRRSPSSDDDGAASDASDAMTPAPSSSPGRTHTAGAVSSAAGGARLPDECLQALRAASSLLQRPSWRAIAKLNRSSEMVVSSETEQPPPPPLNDVAGSVWRLMRVCHKLKSGGRLASRVLVTASVMLAEVQSALDVSLPEALHPRPPSSKKESGESGASQSQVARRESLASAPLPTCAISGAVLRERSGDEPMTLFVPAAIFAEAVGDARDGGNDDRGANTASHSFNQSTHRAGDDPTSKWLREARVDRCGDGSDTAVIVDKDVWLLYVRHCGGAQVVASVTQ